ncbi:3-hydroxymethylcephem carbamoyltransferase [Streptomyces sp. NBC_00876]|uniref:carbamoyltransferase C-terminal domain-containing protein n=1 Tax=Streptomyces sp. NBC_00876 TaxID=2975853 RepID=UPI0038701DC1|nr:3-hydroxymethylcephem carbamoyltransferase [Streptomyces sp. NBC_00876]
MLVFALKPGHDGTVAVIRDRRLLYSLESEKDSFGRYAAVNVNTILDIAEHVDQLPDVVALGGWREQGAMRHRSIGAGYDGLDALTQRQMRFFGKEVRLFSSSHERSHLMMAVGMAPRGEHPLQTVLVWEGDTGAFYLVDQHFKVVKHIPVLTEPGGRFSFLFALADPSFPDEGALPRLNDAGKLMALAAYANPEDADADISAAVDRLLKTDSVYPAPKRDFRDCALYNAGVESQVTKTAAALLTQRIFTLFADAALEHLPAGTPLRISGGCGLNCDWNAEWANLGHFSSVFVPPCTNDSGSAIGTAIDALTTMTGDPYIDWNVYSGLDFVHDTRPDPALWQRTSLDHRALAQALGQGRVVAWVQGRWEIGPRALGNRSLLAEPFRQDTKDLLNTIKQRETYRPIAPCCRIEDIDTVFDGAFEDPYMLYFRKVRRSSTVQAVTHVDGSARVQTVSRDSNQELHVLLSAFAAEHGVGVLCNTSLNFNGHGFINRMSDLVRYCEARGIHDMVVGDQWFQRHPRV